jgi:PLP dependent protein
MFKMADTVSNLSSIKQQLPVHVRIVAVSKTRTVEEILDIYNAGHRVFGENRVQEILAKKELLPSDIEWHLIGHLQSNKVKFIAPFISMIESVDSGKLLSVINSEAERRERIIDCLLQFHIAREETKFGFSKEEVVQMLESEQFTRLKNIRICGVMGMATLSDDKELVRNEFRSLKKLFDDLKVRYFSESSYFNQISMGMSGDYKIAVEEGSTIVRIGSLIFGRRKP